MTNLEYLKSLDAEHYAEWLFKFQDVDVCCIDCYKEKCDNASDAACKTCLLQWLNEEKLERCPVCNNYIIRIKTNTHTELLNGKQVEVPSSYYAECNLCKIRTPNYTSKKMIIKFWNDLRQYKSEEVE